MARRERKWTKVKLLKTPEEHPVLKLWEKYQVRKVLEERGEEGLHFNDLRYMLCKDYAEIKKPPKKWDVFPPKILKRMREYNDYTILQKDLARLCNMGFLEKKARGYYTRVEIPLIEHFSKLSESKKMLIGSTDICEIISTDAIELEPELKQRCRDLYDDLMEQRNANFKDEILSFWRTIESSKLDVQQKILMRNELHPFTRNAFLKRVIKKGCLITVKKSKGSFEIPPYKKRDADKMRSLIDIVRKYEELLGIYAVKYAMGIYTYPNIFTEKYIKEKGVDFKKELKPFKDKLDSILKAFEKPSYVVFAPSCSEG